MKSRHATTTIKELDPEKCKICYSPFSETYLGCKDRFCEICIFEYLKLRILEGQVLRITCPSCNMKIREETLKKIVTTELFLKYLKFYKFRKLLKNKDIKLCPKPDCIGYDEIVGKEVQLTCQVCSYEFCSSCFGTKHLGGCERQPFGYENLTRKTGIKSCPWCKALVKRCGGSCCIKCAFCSFEWCWICETQYSATHSPVNCLIGYQMTDVYWKALIFFLLFPLSYFFLFFFYFWYMSQQNKLWKCLKRYKRVSIIVIFFLSPLLTVLIIPIMINLIMSQNVFNYFHFRSEKFYRTGYKFKLAIIFIIFMPITILIFLGLSAICFAFLPVTSLVFIFIKIIKKMSLKNDFEPQTSRNLVKTR